MGEVPLKTPVNLNWTIKNFVAGMTATLSCDPDPADPNFPAAGLEVTKSLDAAGAGEQKITPTAAGKLTFKLTVTPQAGAPVDSSPISVTWKGGHLFAPKGKALPANSEPAINFFSAYPHGSHLLSTATSIHAPRDGQIILAWEVSGEVESISIDNDLGDVTAKTNEEKDADTNGQGEATAKFSPGSATQVTYTLTLKPTASSSDPKTAKVVVGLPGTVPDHQDAKVPFKLVFTASPATVKRGGQVVLDWRVIGDVDQVNLVGVQDKVALTGPATFNVDAHPPQPDGTYKIQAFKGSTLAGEQTATITLVDDFGGPPTMFKPGETKILDYDGSVLDLAHLGSIKEALHVGQATWFVKFEGDVKFKFNGKFTPAGGTEPKQDLKVLGLKFVDEFAKQLGLDKLAFTGARLEGAALPFHRSQGETSNYWVDLSGSIIFAFGKHFFLKLELAGAKIKPMVLQKSFSVDGPGLTFSLGGTGSYAGPIEEPMPGQLSGTMELTGEFAMTPNWERIIGEILKEFVEKALQEMGIELFGETLAEAAAAAIGDLLLAIAPFAVAAVIIYAFWKLEQDMAEMNALCSGAATNRAVDLWKKGFGTALFLDKYNSPASTEDVYGDGWDKGSTLGGKYLKQFVQSEGVKAWKKKVAQEYPAYGSDPGWVNEKVLDGFHEMMSTKFLEILAKADAAVRPSIHLQLFNAYCDKHDNNLVSCLPVFVNMWPRRTVVDDYKWLPPEVYARADKHGWLKDSFQSFSPPKNPPMLHLLNKKQSRFVATYCADLVILKDVEIGRALLDAGFKLEKGEDFGAKIAPYKTDYVLPLTKRCDADLINTLGDFIDCIRVPTYLVNGHCFTRCTDGWLEIKPVT